MVFWRERIAETDARVARWLWGLIPGVLLLIVVTWLDWMVLWTLLALWIVGGTFWLAFLLLRGVWRGWKYSGR